MQTPGTAGTGKKNGAGKADHEVAELIGQPRIDITIPRLDIRAGDLLANLAPQLAKTSRVARVPVV